MKIRIVSMVGVVLALSVSTPANAASCYDQTVAAMRSVWPEAAGPMTPALTKDAIEKAGTNLLVSKVSPLVEEPCRSLIGDNARAYAQLGQPAEPAATVAPALQQTASQSGGGAMLDAEIAELKAKTGADNAAVAEAAARRAEAAVAEARRERDAAATRLQQIVSRPGVTPAQINAATAKYQAAAKLLEKAETEAKSAKDSAEAAAQSAGLAVTSQIGAAAEHAGAKTQADRSKTEADRAEVAASKWSPWTSTWWDIILAGLIVGLAVGFIIWWKKFRKKDELLLVEPDLTGLVRKEELDGKADTTTVSDLSKRVDELDARLTDTRDQVGAKDISIPADLIPRATQLEQGEEFTTAVVVNDSASEGITYEVGIRKGANDEVFITSGVKGHTVTRAVKISNLVGMLKNAAFGKRLTKKAGA
jgi:hypothetical protein